MSLPDIRLVWPQWHTESLLRQQSHYHVYSAVSDSGEKAAVKILNFPGDPMVLKKAAEKEVDPTLLKRYFKKFKDEVNWELTLFGIADSPHLVKNDAVIFRESESYPGWAAYIRSGFHTPLKEYIAGKMADRETVVRFCRELCSAVIALQSKGMVHGALDPESVVVTDSGSFAVTDYGVTRCLRAAGKSLFNDTYSRFAAPEALEKGKYGEVTEIYSIGMLMVYLLYGGNLPETGDFKAVEENDPILAGLLKKATAAKSADRFPSVGELQRELERLPEEEKKLPEIVKKRRSWGKSAVEPYMKREVFTEKIPPESEVIPPIPRKPESAEPESVPTAVEKLRGRLSGAASFLSSKLPNVSFLKKSTESDEEEKPQLPPPAGQGYGALESPKAAAAPKAIETKDTSKAAKTENPLSGALEADGKAVQEVSEQKEKPEEPAAIPGEESTLDAKARPAVPDKDAELESIIAETKSGKYETSRRQERLIRDLDEEFPQEKITAKRRRGWIASVIVLVLLLLAVAAIVYTQAWKYVPFFKLGTDAAAAQPTAVSGDTINAGNIVDSWDPAAENSDDATSLSEEFTVDDPAAAVSKSPDSVVKTTTSPIMDGYILPTDRELISTSSLEDMTKEETYMALNEIYARHGKIFTTSSIQAYFVSRSWYEPYTRDSYAVYALFSDIEIQNLDTIVQYQQNMGYRS